MDPKADHDVHLIALPMFHSFGQTIQMSAGIYNRATHVVVRNGNVMVK
jgi:long-chain acyl-CoA synthetase